MTAQPYVDDCRLCGTKLGCGEGGCGACTVMVSRMDRVSKKIKHFSVNACLAPVVSMHGMIFYADFICVSNLCHQEWQ